MQAVRDRLIVKRDAEAEQIGGIFIPETNKEKPQTGEVVSVGALVESVNGGERIAFPKYAGIEFGEYLVLKEEEIICVL